MNKFCNKVVKCEHKNLSSNCCECIKCETPGCFGYEVHCLDCGVYISKCGCGYCNGLSGWPELRWRKHLFLKEHTNKGK